MNIEDKAKAQFDVCAISQWTGFFKTVFDLHERTREVCLPAIVQEYDRASHTATVLPLTQYVYTDGNNDMTSDRPAVNVRVLQFYHGGFLVDAPVYANDTGILIAGDRNSSSATSENANVILDNVEFGKSDNKGSVAADFSKLLSFENGFFIPCSFAKFDATEDDELVVLKKDSTGKYMKVKMATRYVELEKTVGDTSDPNNIQIEKYRIDDNGITFTGKEDRVVEVLTDLRYNPASQQIQKRVVEQKIRGDFVVGVSDPLDWTIVEGGQAVPECECQ